MLCACCRRGEFGDRLEIPLLEGQTYSLDDSYQAGYGERLSGGNIQDEEDEDLVRLSMGADYKWQTIELEHLKLNGRIGNGAFGVVYSGLYTDKPVAVKEVNRTQWEKKVQRQVR